MVTGARGEQSIELPDGRQVTVLFTNRALAQAEKALGKSITSLVQATRRDDDLGLGDTLTLLQVGMEAARRDANAGGRPVTAQDALDVMDAVGFTAVALAVMSPLADVLAYAGEDAESPPA